MYSYLQRIISVIAVFTCNERSADSPQDSHKYKSQFQDFFFQTTECLTASRRVQSTGGHIDRFPALDQTDCLSNGNITQYETDGPHVLQSSP
jgi:hypothetical protein